MPRGQPNAIPEQVNRGLVSVSREKDLPDRGGPLRFASSSPTLDSETGVEGSDDGRRLTPEFPREKLLGDPEQVMQMTPESPS